METPPGELLLRAARILLECILVCGDLFTAWFCALCSTLTCVKRYPRVQFDSCVVMVCVIKMRVALETGCIGLPVRYHDVFVWETKLRNFFF